MGREMSLLDEMVMAAGVEHLFRKRRRRTLLGRDRRLALLALVGVGVAITILFGWFQGREGEGRQYSAEYPKFAA